MARASSNSFSWSSSLELEPGPLHQVLSSSSLVLVSRIHGGRLAGARFFLGMGEYPPGSYEKARLRFAHAETVVPFTCLLGLFLDGAEFEQIETKQRLPLPPKPPRRRNWRGGIVLPFAGNNMLVLYSCSDSSSKKYFVQVIHNDEHPIPMPAFDDVFLSPFYGAARTLISVLLKFSRKTWGNPHLKHDYDTLCNATPNRRKQWKSLQTTCWEYYSDGSSHCQRRAADPIAATSFTLTCFHFQCTS